MSRLCCVNATKRLIESVVQITPGQSIGLELAREIICPYDESPLIADLPLLSVTCSNQDFSFYVMAILSSFRGVPVELFPSENQPKHLPVLTGFRPLAGVRLGPDSLSQLVLSASYDRFAGWEPVSQFTSIISSLRSHQFELAVYGWSPPFRSSYSTFLTIPLFTGYNDSRGHKIFLR